LQKRTSRNGLQRAAGLAAMPHRIVKSDAAFRLDRSGLGAPQNRLA